MPPTAACCGAGARSCTRRSPARSRNGRRRSRPRSPSCSPTTSPTRDWSTGRSLLAEGGAAGDRAFRIGGRGRPPHAGLGPAGQAARHGRPGRRELELQVALGSALAGTKGHASLPAERAWRRARELCDALEEPVHLLHVLQAQCSIYVVHAEFDRAREAGEELVRLGETRAATMPQIIGHRVIGSVLFFQGAPITSRHHLEHALRIHDPDQTFSFGFYQDERIICLSYLILSSHQWLRGPGPRAGPRGDGQGRGAVPCQLDRRRAQLPLHRQ